MKILSFIYWVILVNVCLIDIFLVFKLQRKVKEIITRRKTQKMEEKSKKDVRITNLLKQKQAYENAIKVYEERITKKKYTSEKQKKDIETKIAKVKEIKERLEVNLNKLLGNKEPSPKNSKQQIQDMVCEQIKKVIEQEFPKLKYSFKLSNTTTSVYLTLVNDKGVTKTIRFSDHNTYKNCAKYKIDNITSYKKIKTIIESNLKALSRKSVYVLLDKIKKEG